MGIFWSERRSMMKDKYVIFCKCDPIRPISSIDGLINSHVMELSEDEAIKYVNEKNKQYGEIGRAHV